MNNYLTIGEFARLRNVDRKSLRYYERIGALIPAHVDPQTKYRYYTLEQLVDLDTILICLELGIPLKEVTQYKNKDGTLNILKLFNDGKEKINQKFLQLNMTLNRLESSILSIQENKIFENKKDFYKRHINQRYILRKPFDQLNNEIIFRNEAKNLFIEAQSLGLIPIFNFPIGLMAEHYNENINIYMTLEVLPYGINNTEVYILPEGNYLCYQEQTSNLYNLPSHYFDIYAKKEHSHIITISNMTLEKYENGIFPLEVQILTND